MATLNQIKVNTGTEDNPTYVLHDVHDKRLDDGASSLVTTCTHLLATNAALSSFNPITAANLASVLGVKESLPLLWHGVLNSNKTGHVLIAPKGKSYYSAAFLVIATAIEGFATNPTCFFAYAVTDHQGNIAKENITALDGNTYVISDYTKGDTTYRSITITSSQYQKQYIDIYGIDNNDMLHWAVE